jgi:hypothetical protein
VHLLHLIRTLSSITGTPPGRTLLARSFSLDNSSFAIVHDRLDHGESSCSGVGGIEPNLQSRDKQVQAAKHPVRDLMTTFLVFKGRIGRRRGFVFAR